MIRLICGGVLCLCSSYIGLVIKRYYHIRSVFFADFVRFIEILHEEISFMKSPLNRIIINFKDGKKGEFVRILEIYENMLNGDINAENLAAKINSVYINKSEKEMLVSMLAQLGKLDSATQITNLANYKARVSAKAQESKKKSVTIGGLSFKLGVLLGVMIMIIVA